MSVHGHGQDRNFDFSRKLMRKTKKLFYRKIHQNYLIHLLWNHPLLFLYIFSFLLYLDCSLFILPSPKVYLYNESNILDMLKCYGSPNIWHVFIYILHSISKNFILELWVQWMSRNVCFVFKQSERSIKQMCHMNVYYYYYYYHCAREHIDSSSAHIPNGIHMYTT